MGSGTSTMGASYGDFLRHKKLQRINWEFILAIFFWKVNVIKFENLKLLDTKISFEKLQIYQRLPLKGTV